ncbi:MAG: 4-amino-4-deoxychorismate lyase [Crocinitomicaceae bacterium]|nr:4-amino-4-deoxychorismate lyase [Crocinitomicaceae bacterium]|tara:strand:+ start:8499 stop:9350 length:852 start_codon:yes stop_codon:yes gene_type:complete
MVSRKFLYSGAVVNEHQLPNAFESRGFLYADGFFETMRCINGRIPLFHLHYGRIVDSASAYKMDLPQWMQEGSLLTLLEELSRESALNGDTRIRLTIYRDGEGGYTPTTNFATAIGSVEHTEGNGFELNEKGLAIGLYQELAKTPSRISNLKNLHSQLYVQAGNFAKYKGLGDVLILNDYNQLIEATSSNIFLVFNGALHTPKLEAGPVGGVMRAAVINLALKLNIKVYECNLEAHELIKADEVFLTNALKGIQWVASYRTKRYFNKTASMLLEKLNEEISFT